MDLAFTPAERVELQGVISDAVLSALNAFALGRRWKGAGDGAAAGVGVEEAPEATWRKAASLRYASGTWKRSLTDVIPFARFRPSEIVREFGERLKSEHPTHHHIESAVANVLKWLCQDGVIVKIETGIYAPAIDGHALIE